MADLYDETDEMLDVASKQTEVLRDIRLLLLVIALAAVIGVVLGIWAAFGNLPVN